MLVFAVGLEGISFKVGISVLDFTNALRNKPRWRTSTRPWHILTMMTHP